MKSATIGVIIYFAILMAVIMGEVKCIIKMCQCNWEPIGKAEIIYTVGTFTGAGVIIGYLNIEDK